VSNVTFDSTADYWSVPVETLLRRLDSTIRGLSSEQASGRRRDSERIETRESSDLHLLARQFRSPIILLLAVAAILSMALGEVVDASIVIGILLLSGGLGFLQERGAVKAIHALMSSVAVHADVLRDGQETEVLVGDVVPGDVVLVRTGDVIPGDGRVIESDRLLVNQAALTGEDYPRARTTGEVSSTAALVERTNCLYLGTHVASGRGRVLITRVGRSTEFGRLGEHVARQHVPTAFERGITSFGYMLMRATAVLVLAIFVFNIVLHRPFIDSFLFSLALAVGLTPQMLPAIITLSLSKGAVRMARDRVIVKRLDAIEDVGSLDVLCTDKTGTLTVGSVSLHGALGIDGHTDEWVRTIGWWNARLQTGFPNPIDTAISATAEPAGPDWKLLDEVPFDFTRKRTTLLVDDTRRLRLIVKGSVDTLWAKCSRVRLRDGSVVDFTSHRVEVLAVHGRLAAAGLRIIGVAEKEVDPSTTTADAEESDLVFSGFLTFADPPKLGVEEALRRFGEMGVAIKLITGDNEHSAGYVAAAVNLPEGRHVSGVEIVGMSDDELDDIVDASVVFSNTDPLQKERIIRSLIRRGHSVGFLGDGINDAPALHAADVGISVEGAVDVAKQTADLVLLEKDLGVLANGIEEGRRIFTNTLKYVGVTTSANFGNMLSLAIASVILPFLPLLPLQILLLNFLSDVPGMTIATDLVDTEQIARPIKWDIRRIQLFMVVFGTISTVFDLTTFVVLRLLFDSQAELLRSGWFVESTFTELAVMLVLRTSRPCFRSRPSRPLLWVSVATAGVTIALPYLPVASGFGLTGLPMAVLASMILITVAYIALTEILKMRWKSILITSSATAVV
jgi:Mg2+-importing ATPase